MITDHAYEGTRDSLAVGLLDTLSGEWSPCEICGRPISEHELPAVLMMKRDDT